MSNLFDLSGRSVLITGAGRGIGREIARTLASAGADIAIAETGCWRWATDKPDLHRYVRDYFAARKEDG